MINEKYYQDVKDFPNQFAKGLEIAKKVELNKFADKEWDRVVVCGMGGSSLYVELINDFLDSEEGDSKLRLEANRNYNLPKNADGKTLFIVASYSGNTEETLSCLDQIQRKGWNCVAFSSGGKLLDRVRISGIPYFVIPTGRQPRLATGYFISGILKILERLSLIESKDELLTSAAENLESNLVEEEAKALAKRLVEKVPIIYSTDNNSSISRIAKIKFNENSKVQCFHNHFPELNHNEMEGFTKMVMEAYFIIFKSKFTNIQNLKRIEIFSRLISDKSWPVRIIEMLGKNNFEEILNAYYFIDHVTYYLAEEYGTDPEEVKMVEEFKLSLNR